MKHFALGRLPVGAMNKTEAAYSATLELQKRAGDVLWYRFEGVKLRLADNTFLTVDFPVLRNDGLLEMHEVKGYFMDDAKVKIKVAAEMYPFKFFIVRKLPAKDGGGWSYEQV